MKVTALPVGIPLLAAAVVLGAPSRAESCSCGPPRPVLEALQEAKAVFLGVVVSVGKPVLDGEGAFGPLVVRFRVSRAWKGVSGEDVEVRTAVLGTACGYSFEVGEEYLVYTYVEPALAGASSPDDRVWQWTSDCSRTAHFRDAERSDL